MCSTARATEQVHREIGVTSCLFVHPMHSTFVRRLPPPPATPALEVSNRLPPTIWVGSMPARACSKTCRAAGTLAHDERCVRRACSLVPSPRVREGVKREAAAAHASLCLHLTAPPNAWPILAHRGRAACHPRQAGEGSGQNAAAACQAASLGRARGAAGGGAAARLSTQARPRSRGSRDSDRRLTLRWP